MRAIRFDNTGGPEVLYLADLPTPEPGPGEILIRHQAIGVNFIDTYHRTGLYPVALPSGLGQEGAGVVEAVGDGVTAVAPGDPVVIGWPSCGQCRNCRQGEPRYCLRLGEALCSGGRLLGPRAGETALHRPDGSPLHSHFFGQSSLATHSLVWADALVPIPEGLPV